MALFALRRGLTRTGLSRNCAQNRTDVDKQEAYMQSSSSETESDQHLQLTQRVLSTSLSFVEVVASRYLTL